MKKEARRHLLEHAKTMAGTVREAYGEVPGRAQDALFSEHGADASPEGSRERSKRIFYDFGYPFGVPGAPFWEQKGVFFALFFQTGKTIKMYHTLGGAGGRGVAPWVFRICRMGVIIQSRPVP